MQISPETHAKLISEVADLSRLYISIEDPGSKVRLGGDLRKHSFELGNLKVTKLTDNSDKVLCYDIYAEDIETERDELVGRLFPSYSDERSQKDISEDRAQEVLYFLQQALDENNNFLAMLGQIDSEEGLTAKSLHQAGAELLMQLDPVPLITQKTQISFCEYALKALRQMNADVIGSFDMPGILSLVKGAQTLSESNKLIPTILEQLENCHYNLLENLGRAAFKDKLPGLLNELGIRKQHVEIYAWHLQIVELVIRTQIERLTGIQVLSDPRPSTAFQLPTSVAHFYSENHQGELLFLSLLMPPRPNFYAFEGSPMRAHALQELEKLGLAVGRLWKKYLYWGPLINEENPDYCLTNEGVQFAKALLAAEIKLKKNLLSFPTDTSGYIRSTVEKTITRAQRRREESEE
jgi:hypothetical protein